MFFDDKLKEVYNEHFSTSSVFDLKEALVVTCLDKIKEITSGPYESIPVDLKKADNGWRLFCKKTDATHLFSEEGFQNLVWELSAKKNGKDSAGRLFTYLGWHCREK